MILPSVAIALCFASTVASAAYHGQRMGHHVNIPASKLRTGVSAETDSNAHSRTAGAKVSKLVLGAFLNDWSGSNLTKVPWKNYTEMDYFTAETTNSVNSLSFTNPKNDSAYIQEFTKRAKSAGVQSILTIGGWTGSVYFSNMVATSANRTAFVKTVIKVINQYGFDGVDFDWEYPANAGAGNNFNKNDAANFLLFLQELRRVLGTSKKIVADVASFGILGSDWTPLKNVSGFAAVLDYILVMCFENSGSWTKQTGPNAPLYSTAAPDDQTVSVDTAIKYWTGAGFSASKIILGAPTFAKFFYTSSSELTQTKYNGIASSAYQNYTTTADDKEIGYGDMVKQKLIDAGGKAIASSGYTRYWDSASQTPFLFNPSKKIYITYDDSSSIAAKAKYVVSKGMGGIKFYDYQGITPVLLDAAKKVLDGA